MRALGLGGNMFVMTSDLGEDMAAMEKRVKVSHNLDRGKFIAAAIDVRARKRPRNPPGSP